MNDLNDPTRRNEMRVWLASTPTYYYELGRYLRQALDLLDLRDGELETLRAAALEAQANIDHALSWLRDDAEPSVTFPSLTRSRDDLRRALSTSDFKDAP